VANYNRKVASHSSNRILRCKSKFCDTAKSINGDADGAPSDG
jgi:hypothetical protein